MNGERQQQSIHPQNAAPPLAQAAAPPAATLLTLVCTIFRRRRALPGPAGVFGQIQQQLGHATIEHCPTSQAGAQLDALPCEWTPHESRCGPGALNGGGAGGQDTSSSSSSVAFSLVGGAALLKTACMCQQGGPHLFSLSHR
jgi:hypothetical protein